MSKTIENCGRCGGSHGSMGPCPGPTREPGWYWIKVEAESPWVAGQWTGHYWRVHGFNAMFDVALAAIGPRILPPDEPAPKAGASDSDLEQAHYIAFGCPAALSPGERADLTAEIGTLLAAVRRESTSAERNATINDLRACGDKSWRNAHGLINQIADYLTATEPRDIAAARERYDPRYGALETKAKAQFVKDGNRITELEAQLTTARDPGALLLAEAERLQAIPNMDTDLYVDYQERQRLARGYQDAAKLLGEGGK